MSVGDWFASVSNAKKISYIVLLAAAIAGLFMLFSWAGQPQYQLLYANLSNEDAAAVVDKLDADNISYKIGGGGTISVPKDDVYETRLRLAGEGIPKGGGVGFEIFDKSGFGVTEFVQKVNYLRATQGELQRTISGLSEVDSARVHIVVPEKRLFQSDKDVARASVVLKLVGNQRLGAEQIQSVVNLVAGSVSDLSPQNITVIDTKGRLLTKAAGDDGGAAMLSSTQLEYQRSVEKNMEARIRTILEPVVGVDKVKASVSVEIDFKQVEKTEERYDPDSVVVRSEQTSKEKTTGATAGGAPGVASNVPGGTGATQSGSAPESTRQNETINYEISKVVSRTVEPTGAIKRLSVAVLVDGAYTVITTGEGEDAVTTSEYKPRADEEIKKFEDLIRGAVGFSTERGDSLEVVNIPFEARIPIVEFEDVKESMLEMYLPSMIRYGTIMLLALLVLFFVIRPLIKGIFKESAGMMMAEPGVPLPAEGVPMPAMEEPEEELPTSPVAKKKKTVKDIVEGNPEQSAQIVKRWVRGKTDEE